MKHEVRGLPNNLRCFRCLVRYEGVIGAQAEFHVPSVFPSYVSRIGSSGAVDSLGTRNSSHHNLLWLRDDFSRVSAVSSLLIDYPSLGLPLLTRQQQQVKSFVRNLSSLAKVRESHTSSDSLETASMLPSWTQQENLRIIWTRIGYRATHLSSQII
jgi:hypothetical protein